ncbi:hypothetical protein [Amycolatopsis lexingtonensis]|uniref:hypothetical protein n=1 Tax=Amycolatopsis lexingtonensis TaxID=218822 RepID=UPI003F71237D
MTDVWTVEMSPELAELIRSWRVDEEQSWRDIAARTTRHLGLAPSDNQLAGRALCSRAAELLGEEPWN